MGYKIHRFFSPSPCLIGCTDGYFIKRSSDRIFFCLRNVTAEEHGVYILSFFFLPLDWTTWSFLPSASANERKCLLRLKGYAIIRLPHVRSEKKKSPSVFRRSRIFFPVSPRRLLSVPCRVSIRLVINIKAGLQVKMTCSLHFILFLFRSNFCCFVFFSS